MRHPIWTFRRLIHQHPLKSMRHRHVRTVVFDLSGTLVDAFGYGPRMALLSTLQPFIPSIRTSEIEAGMGNSKRVHISQLLERKDVQDRWLKHNGKPITTNDIEHVYKLYVNEQVRLLYRDPWYSEFVPHAKETLKELASKNMYIGITTGYTRAMITPILKHLKTHGAQFHASVTSDEVPRPRPFPDGIVKILRQLHESPHHCIKVGDTAIDIDEGNNAGCVTVGVTRYASGSAFGDVRESFKHADYVIPTLAQLSDVINDVHRKSK